MMPRRSFLWRALLGAIGLAAIPSVIAQVRRPFPAFVRQNSDSEDVIAHLGTSAPARSDSFNKFQFVEWVAEELRKRESFMSAPTLARLLNDRGYRTNYNSEYSGAPGARSIHNLISGTYYRLDHAGKSDRAQMVAKAFRKPNFEYAYEQ